MGLIILVTISAKAQYFYTSYGIALEWQIPNYIEHTIYNDYYGYEVAHVERHEHHGYTNFDVLLHRGNFFVEVRFDRFGNIYRTVRYDYFPLNTHVCTVHCGYHKAYYQTYYYPEHHHYYHPYSTTVFVTKTEPYHHYDNKSTKVYVQHNGGNNGNGHKPKVNNNNGNRTAAPRYVTENRSNNGALSGRGNSGRGNK